MTTELSAAPSVPHTIQWAGTMFSVFFRDGAVTDYDDARQQDTDAFRRFFHAMLAQGVHLPPSSFESWFVSASHDDEAVEHVVAALPAAARAAATPDPRLTGVCPLPVGRLPGGRWKAMAAPSGRSLDRGRWAVFARSTTVMGQPGMMDAGIQHVRDVVMPQVRDMDGCVGLSLIADRAAGRCIVTTAWRSAEAMSATADSVAPIRTGPRRCSVATPPSTSGRWPTFTATTGRATVPAPG